jgi:hypothetical protein
MQNLDSLRAEKTIQPHSFSQRCAIIQTRDRKPFDGNTGTCVAIEQRTVIRERHDRHIEPIMVESLGGSNRVQLGATEIH